MSQYMTFYIKPNKGEYVPIGTFSRSDTRYQAICDHLRYGVNQPVTAGLINEVLDELKMALDENKRYLKAEQDKVSIVAQFNNSAEEKMEVLNDINNTIRDIQDCIDEAQYGIGWYTSLAIIVSEAEDSHYYSNPDKHYDADNFLFVNWEAEDINGEEDED